MIRVAINGFGRIGRNTLKAILGTKNTLEIVAINDLTDNKTLAHLLKYDTVYGRYEKSVDHDDEHLVIDGKKIRVYAERDPSKLPWKSGGGELISQIVNNATIGDYAIMVPSCKDPSKNILAAVFERKTWKDLAASLKDQRCTTQHKNMVELRDHKGCKLYYIRKQYNKINLYSQNMVSMKCLLMRRNITFSAKRTSWQC